MGAAFFVGGWVGVLEKMRDMFGLPALMDGPQNTAAVDSWDGLRGIFGATPGFSGEVVNEQTAMRVSAVYACVRLIAGSVAQLPVHVYRRTGMGERERIDHDYWWLLNEQASPAWTSAAMWEYSVASMLLRGNGYAYLLRSRAGQVTGVVPLSPSRVIVDRVTSDDPRQPHRLRYFVHTDSGTFGVDQDDMLHFPGLGFDGVSGKSVIEYGALESTGIAIGANRQAGEYFANGGQYQHAIKAAGAMKPEQQDALRNAWATKYGTGRSRSDVPLILTEGLDIQELTVSARDAQLLETRQWQAVDIARAFGVPAHMINESGVSAWGSGIEQMGIGYVTYTLNPTLRRIAQELNRKLFRTAGMFVAHNTAALMQGDHKSRSEYYKAGLGGTQNPAWLTQNEVRKLENLPPVEGGDVLIRPDGGSENVGQPA